MDELLPSLSPQERPFPFAVLLLVLRLDLSTCVEQEMFVVCELIRKYWKYGTNNREFFSFWALID